MKLFKVKKCDFSKSISGIVVFLFFRGLLLLLEYEPFTEILLEIVSREFLNKYCNLLFYRIFFIMFCCIYRSKLIEALKDFIKNHEEYFKSCGIIALITIILMVLLGVALSKIDFQPGGSNEQAIEESLRRYGFLSIVWICFIGPFVEEIVYRGIIYEILRGNKKNVGRILCAMCITAIIFGVIHCNLQTLIQKDYIHLLAYTPQMVMGLLLTILYEKTDNIFCPYVVHMMINMIASSG